MNRAISQNEVAVVRWLLDNALIQGTAIPSQDVSALQVVGGCACGCISISFDTADGSRIIADAVARYSDGKQAGLLLWGTDAAVSSLEVYDLDPEASHRIPDVGVLRAWEDYYESA